MSSSDFTPELDSEAKLMKYAASLTATEFFRHIDAGSQYVMEAYQRGKFDYWWCWVIGSHILAALQAAGYRSSFR